jgi:MinD superfamily P-loop ATPase
VLSGTSTARTSGSLKSEVHAFIEEAEHVLECGACQSIAWLRAVWIVGPRATYAIFCEGCGDLYDSSPPDARPGWP